MLEVRQLDAFHGDAQALWEVDLTVGEGEIVGVVGPNGAGKSTLVLAIAGLHRSVRGSIVVDGVDLTTIASHRVCEYGVATVPEGRRVFPRMSVYDNLCLGAYRKGARSDHRDALDYVHTLFPRLQERSAQYAASLSGGEQQMLAIGRALMARPRLLLMDEPSLGLAPVVVDEVFEAIEAINREGVSVLLVEQEIERALEITSRGYLLAEGRIVASGTSAELLQSPMVRSSVLGI
ncbi:MAG TPA: ABC transporter ATP-binding protein [Jiangellaceae bacterium]|nr:ABC transporter ATP-binding protein [Jiangellaceae bacterium]